MTKTFSAWAVRCDCRNADGKWSFFLGHYIWLDGNPPKISPQTEGCMTALLKTRAVARRLAKQHRGSGHVTLPVRVLVQITEVP